MTPIESPAENVRNALAILVAGVPLQAADLEAVRARLERAIEQLEGT